MRRRSLVGGLLAALAVAGAATAGWGSEAADRLDRFRELAAARLGALELSGTEPTPDVLGELYALLDDEIVESLRSGPPFASEGFLQERLDAFSEAWGGSAFRILSLRGSGLTVGAFQLSPGGGNSVRVYGGNGPGAALIQAFSHEGAPVLHEMQATRGGDPQFLVAWVGPRSGRGSTALGLALWRGHGAAVAPVWSTDGLAPGGLWVSRFALGAQQVSVRYELRYPGWKPGCEGQTEHEDVYRYETARDTFILARRRVLNGWHRELHAAVGALLSALERRDRRALSALVADGALRRRLPPGLEPDLGCDERNAAPPTVVTVTAIEPGDPRRPWALTFRRSAQGWRLTDARIAE